MQYCPFKSTAMARLPLQLPLPTPPTWGGRRKSAGRKRAPGTRPSVAHRPRPGHDKTTPVHVTLRAALRCLRADHVYGTIRSALAVSSHERFRIIQFSVQDDHVHMLVEAEDRQTLARGTQGLAIRVARAVNRALGRRGRVWAGRYHARALTTPRAVRNALVYVLMNSRKHGKVGNGLDPCSSARWFTGWREPVEATSRAAPVAAARTWLARVGWRRHGLIGMNEQPSGSRATRARTSRG